MYWTVELSISSVLITLCAVCTGGLCNQLYVSVYVYMYYVTKYWLFSILPVKKCLEKYMFPFTFRRRDKCERKLPVHSRLSITHVYLLMLVLPDPGGQMLGVSGDVTSLSHATLD